MTERRANIWRQLINGSAPTQLIDFQGDEIFDFAYSRDGNWLAVTRGRFTGDVLRITDLNWLLPREMLKNKTFA
jgi:hypothetical protein